ncbi:MAG TPA: ABC transporter substrate-binding protein [Desulfovibrio sp.]|uniref:substrate-binding periplasmic protein n=1 Tax=Nitratidesulfovibrio vulgaris TaxID=881 RepID=UPI000E96C231|nr:transporter substrate-binding domain-containing protein [Nitratidesulfovibrio vulgaris]HBW15823.1 ABC transporter substrate-binding protein [Desulfovibrio sp.]
MRCGWLLGFLFLLSVLSYPRPAVAMTVLAEEYAPLSYSVDGQPRGFAVELFHELERRLALPPSDVTFMAWSRAYRLLLRGPRHAILFMGRTMEREDKVWFVGPIWVEDDYFYKKAGSHVAAATLDEARAVSRIGVVRDDFYQLRLQEMGFTNLDLGTSHEQGLRKLAQGRVDLVPMGELTAASQIANYPGLSMDSFERTDIHLLRSEMYIGFSRDMAWVEVERWQKALDHLRQDGTYDQILRKFVPQWRSR